MASSGSGWTLAIDFGTSFTTAATWSNGRLGLVDVGGSQSSQFRMPSGVWVDPAGELVVGWRAEGQAPLAPERLERAPKQLLGDLQPMQLGRDVAIEEAVAAVLRAVLTEALRQEGGSPPETVVLTHPASWPERRKSALRDAAAQAGIEDPHLLPEPVGAAVYFTGPGANGGVSIDPGTTVAVYDLGGGTFDTAVLRRTAEGDFEPIGVGGRDGLGGEVFDTRLFRHIRKQLIEESPKDWHAIDRSPRALQAFRREVRTAKEALSIQGAYDVVLPEVTERVSVRVTRTELEELLDDDVRESVDILVQTCDQAGIEPPRLGGVFLVGGSSRIPLVGDRIAGQMGRVPDTRDNPKAVVALGAAALGAGQSTQPATVEVVPEQSSPHPVRPEPVAPATKPAARPAPKPAPRPAPEPAAAPARATSPASRQPATDRPAARPEPEPRRRAAPTRPAAVPRAAAATREAAVPKSEAVTQEAPVARAEAVTRSMDRPRPAEDAGEARKPPPAPRRGRLLGAAAAALLGLAVVAFLVGKGSGGDAPAAAEGNLASAGDLALTFPDGWRRLGKPPEIPGLDVTDPIALGPADGGDRSGAVAGIADAGGPSLLPAGFLKTLDKEPPRDDAVRLGEVQAYRYRDLHPKGFDGRLDLFVAPASTGVVTIACFAPRGEADFAARCESVAGTLDVKGDAKPLPLGADAAYAKLLNGAIKKLNSVRGPARRRLNAASKPDTQAETAARIAAAYGAAGRTLGKAEVAPAERDAHDSVVAALRDSQRAYDQLATAARRDDAGRYRRAARGVQQAEADLRRALGDVQEIGRG